MFLAVFYVIWRVIVVIWRAFVAVLAWIWRGVPYLFKFMYYFYAWPLLLFEYLWKRGGIYRILSIAVFVIIALVAISTFLRGSPNQTPLSPAPIEAAPLRTVTPQQSSVQSRTRTATRRRVTQTPTRTSTRPNATTQPTRPRNTQAAQVIRVVDGDTVIVRIDKRDVRLRLIGIDTPESVDPRQPVQCFGVEASNYTKRALTNKIIYLERDASQGEYDKYNRLLVYIWLDNTTLFNHRIIDDGYAFEYTYSTPYRYQSLFKRAQTNARTTAKGLWSPSTCNGNVDPQATVTHSSQSPTITPQTTATMTAGERAYPCQVGQIKGNPDSMIYHVPTGASYAQTRNSRVVCFDTESAATLAGYRKASR